MLELNIEVEIFIIQKLKKKEAEEYIELIERKIYEDPIVTVISPAVVFYIAEEYHQNYYNEKQFRVIVKWLLRQSSRN
jgi:peptide-methionine (S)-S-oxide reductase